MKWSGLITVSIALFVPLAVRGQLITDANVFNTGAHEATVTMSTEYGEGQFPRQDAVDRTTSQTFFGDYQRGGTDPSSDVQLMTISNFSAPTGITSLVFFDPNQYEPGRVATQVTIYYSFSNTTSQDTTAFFALNGGNPYTLALSSGGHYTTASSGTYFDELSSLAIPAGVQSLLLDFGPDREAYGGGPTDYHVGVGFQDIQAIAAVPEPSSYAMFAASLMGLVGWLRLRRVA